MRSGPSVPAGCIGVKNCGFQFNARLPEPLVSATFSYRFKFSEGYTWTNGGKLPGVCSEGAQSLAILGCRSCFRARMPLQSVLCTAEPERACSVAKFLSVGGTRVSVSPRTWT